MKFTEFITKAEKIGRLPLSIISGAEFFLKNQVLSVIKKCFFASGGQEQGLIVFRGEDPGNKKTDEYLDGSNFENSDIRTSYRDIFEEIGTVSMFGAYKLVIVENADNFLETNQQKLLEFLGNQFDSNCLVLNILSMDKRKKIVKALNGNNGVLIECNRLYDSPAPWEKFKAEYDSELTNWIVMHAECYGKKMNLETAFSLLEKTGNDLAIIDKQIEILSIYVDGRKQITGEDIQKVLGVSHREKIYHLLDAVGSKDFISAMRMVKLMFDTGIENERKNIIYDEKAIAITIISSIHKRMRDLWKSVRIINKGGSDEEIMENTSQKRIFVDKIRRQARNFVEEEMPDKWKFMLEADLLCKTSNLSPVIIIEQLTAKLCM